ncbi:MAG: hypothetical protein IKO62_10090 [Bacteroidales bacterium]|nr:hypothetical protein [Bacteroidales bacterium]
MKRLSLILVLSLFVLAFAATPMRAQNTPKTCTYTPSVKFPAEKPDFQGILQLKFNYIKENLTITGKNADKFWALYEKYITEESKIHAEFKKAMDEKGIKREILKSGKGTDEQISAYLSQKMIFKDKMYLLDKKFYSEAKVLLTAKELYDFYHLEQSFKDQCTRRQQQAQVAKKQAQQPAPQKK